METEEIKLELMLNNFRARNQTIQPHSYKQMQALSNPGPSLSPEKTSNFLEDVKIKEESNCVNIEDLVVEEINKRRSYSTL